MYDVVIAGAGPSGAILAHQLASAGARVLIAERERLPRYKTCGGGVTLRAARLIPFDLSPVVERSIYDAHVSLRLGHSFQRSSPDPLTYMTMRSKLDEFLVRKAQEAGADLLENARVEGVAPGSRGVSVTTSRGRFEASFAAGCDGANSAIGHSVGITPAQWSAVGLEMECESSLPAGAAAWTTCGSIDIGVLPGGYAWVFPKADHLSIGASAGSRYARRLRSYLEEFTRSRGIGRNGNVRAYGHKLPLRKPRVPVSTRRVLLLGDAAGLVEPFSGEGIYSAVKSARLAGRALTEAPANDDSPAGRYRRLIHSELIPELNTAAITVKLFRWAPPLFFHWMRSSDRVWAYTRRLLRGEDTYLTMRRKLGIFGKTHDMFLGWNPLGW